MVILSLDVSASCTGWAVFKDGELLLFGTIKTKPKFSLGERLTTFRQELLGVLKEYKPCNVVIEDAFSGINVKTLKVLCKFAGVAEQVCCDFTKMAPYIISNNTVKAYFKAKDKKALFFFVKELMGESTEDWTFNKFNDITDSVAQGLCYIDTVLELKSYRSEEEYGYSYKGDING